jgi:hypothetical protein
MINIKKIFTKEYYFRKWWKIFPEYRYMYLTKKIYKEATGKKMSYCNPIDLSEKLIWLTYYWRHPLKTYCADKYLVRNYVESKGYGDLLIPLVNVWNTIEEIDFSTLPSNFVLKCNHGSGCNILCINNNLFDFAEAMNKLYTWMNTDYSEIMFELHYKAIPRNIICEKLISRTAPIEYQFWCLNGKAESILVCRKNFDGTYDANSYSLNWEKLYDRINENYSVSFNKPNCLSKLIEISECLAQPFPFVRADFYVVDERIYFAELTFTPAGNILPQYTEKFKKRLGEKLILPKKII